MSVQALRDAAMVESPVRRSVPPPRDRLPARRDVAVTQRTPQGDPQGFWPAAMRGRIFADVGTGIQLGSPEHTARRHAIPPLRSMYVDNRQVAQPQRMLSTLHPERYDAGSSYGGNSKLYAGPIEDDPPYARRFFVPRTTHTYVESWATHKSYGASAVASGMEGTRVVFPFRFPRRMANPAAQARSVRQRPMGPPGQRMTANVTVVQAAGRYP